MAEPFSTETLNDPEASAARLRQHVDAIRKLKEEAKTISDAVAFRYAALKSEGFDKDVVRVLVRRLEDNRDELADADTILHLYETWYHNDTDPELAAAMAETAANVSRMRNSKGKRELQEFDA